MTLPDLFTRLRVRVGELERAAGVPDTDKAAFLALGALQDCATMKREQVRETQPEKDRHES